MNKPFQFVWDEALPKMRQAFLDKKLGAQHPNFANRPGGGCFYRFKDLDNAPCVVGAALPDDLACAIDDDKSHSGGICDVEDAGHIKIIGVDGDTLSYIQGIHDGGHLWELGKLLGVDEQRLVEMGYRPY